MCEADAGALAGRWDIGAIRATSLPALGATSQVVQISAERGEYFLRGSRYADRARVEDEHALIAHARARGVSAVAPLELPGGGTILESRRRFFALFPRASGSYVAPDALGPAEARAMGACLAGLHEALRGFPPSRLHRSPAISIAVDPASTLAAIARYEERIRSMARPTAEDSLVLARLAGQRAWIERNAAGSMAALRELEQQPTHGDYLPANLFFDGGRVSAIIDWDQAYLAPRAWEVMRTIDLGFGYDPPRAAAFVAGYRAVRPLSLADLDVAAACYCLARAHDLWMYEAIYDAGNERVRAFIGAEGFRAHDARWAALRPYLA